ncbi:hypothetical protein Y032_0042g493, partial [Ancylostoma ceylanicum]
MLLVLVSLVSGTFIHTFALLVLDSRRVSEPLEDTYD